MSKKVSLVCPVCGKEFQRTSYEVRRNEKRGRVSTCSHSCAAKRQNGSQFAEWRESEEWRNVITADKSNELTPVNKLLNDSKCRAKQKGFAYNLTASYLRDLWEEQDGRCAWTGVKLILPIQRSKHDTSNPNIIASLDRKENNKGYEVGNVQFVMAPLNLAKRHHSDDVVRNLISLIREGA